MTVTEVLSSVDCVGDVEGVNLHLLNINTCIYYIQYVNLYVHKKGKGIGLRLDPINTLY